MPAATELPDSFRLLVAYPPESAFLPLAQALVFSIDASDVAAWKADGLGRGTGGAGLRAAIARHDAPVDRLLEIERVSVPLITLVRQGNAVLVDSFCPGSTGAVVAAAWLSDAARLARELLGRTIDRVTSAEISRLPSAAAQFLPSPPLLRHRHLFLTSEAEIRDVYGAAAGACRAAWQDKTPLGNHLLVTRALDAVDEAAWVAATQAQQLGLAKRAPPGSTEWRRAVRADWNRRWLAAPHVALGFVGYDPAQGLVEFTGGGPQGLAIGELQALHELRAQGRDGMGRPVRHIRVVYPGADCARIDATALADLGIGCFAMDERGTTVAVAPAGP
jgi:hypothetical protein